MLNWTDLCGLLMILAGPCSGVAAAQQHKAGALSLILFGAVGLAIGFRVGMLSRKLSYQIIGLQDATSRIAVRQLHAGSYGFTVAGHSDSIFACDDHLWTDVIPLNSLQPTPVGRLSSAFAVDITAPAWLSSGRSAD
jgi:hypothetical protein